MKKHLNAGKRLWAVGCLAGIAAFLMSSSHREAPLIANDPQADNTDLYVFRSVDKQDKITIIANYYPGQLPNGGPNYYQFGENIRYEIHVDNNVSTPGDDIVYRFTFKKANEDPTTFFNIRLGKQNLKTTYTLERSMNGGSSFQTIVQDGVVPPYNIGPRSISSPVGLNAHDYGTLYASAITTATTGEQVFAGPVDDPFFVDLGGIFDLGDAPRTTRNTLPSSDALKCKNVSTIALQIDIETLQKNHVGLRKAKNILDPDYVIGVWASASRRSMRVLNGDGTETHSGKWVQVSRLGMPLTNEAVIPIGWKDFWNSLTPYQDLTYLNIFGKYFYNPELALYMDDTFFGGAIPALKQLRIQRNSLGAFGFGNQQDGLFSLKGSSALNGTALAEDAFGKLLLPAPKSPRSVDLWPIFNTGVPNLPPYQLATGKAGNPLAPGKPFVSNFLPNGGDMLRLNMAVNPTKRDDPKFSSLGLIQAAVLGLTDTAYNKTKNIQWIPNMDGFPNGRRLEDDVTRIELQAVSGMVLAALGLWYDDFVPSKSPVTQDLINVLTYSTGVNENDTTFKRHFPYEQLPWAGTSHCTCDEASNMNRSRQENDVPVADINQPMDKLALTSPEVFLTAYPNPAISTNTVKYHVAVPSKVMIAVYDATGKQLNVLVNKQQDAGTYSIDWNSSKIAKGVYYVSAIINGSLKQSVRILKE
ncbi:DUF4331 family protein [Danxiaibacter flavus]|uniref:DUF4331 family protein n=1 Tax=Danxiaibacter flavus TaxID=3049108 RepID=A0ABV3ZDC5_9BACT|nr:DUF4331 family protein [Chitinophagaceae bacterium DXS]